MELLKVSAFMPSEEAVGDDANEYFKKKLHAHHTVQQKS
jgi:hypothetical protein